MEDHEIAKIFPMMGEADLHELSESIAENGQRESILIYEGKILDGRNRFRACIIAGVAPKTEIFDPKKHGASPVDYVMDLNLHRRQLTTSQRAAAAAEQLIVIEKLKNPSLPEVEIPKNPSDEDDIEFTTREKGTTEKQDNGGENVVEFKGKGTTETEPEKPKKTQAEAAAESGVSERSVNEAAKLQKESPEEFEKVKQGEKSLNQAKKDQETKKLLETKKKILKELQANHGKEFATAINNNTILKTVKEFAAFNELDLEDQKAVVPLISTGWTVKKALAITKDKITTDSTIGQLINKAIASQAEELAFELNGWEIAATKIN